MAKKKKKDKKAEKNQITTLTLTNEQVNDALTQAMQSAIDKIAEQLFAYGSPARKVMEERLNALLIPQIERSNFSNQLVKVDTILNEIVSNCSAAEMSRHLQAFAKYTEPLPSTGKVAITDIMYYFGEWCASIIDTQALDIDYDSGTPTYEPVTITASIEEEEPSRYSLANHATLCLKCEEDPDLNIYWPMTRWAKSEYWVLSVKPSSFTDLVHASAIELHLAALANASAKVFIADGDLDTEKYYELDREPEPQMWR